MKSYASLSDGELVRYFETLVTQDRATAANLLAVMGEVDGRKLYLPAGYPSLLAWCVAEFRMSEDVAFHRIRAARTARLFPALLPALADGRLHLTAVLLLAPWLTHGNVAELIAEATHKTRREIETLIARRFPRPDVFTWVEEPVSGPAAPGSQLVPERVGTAPGPTVENAPLPHAPVRSKVEPLSGDSYGVQLPMSRAAHAKLRYVQDLLSHEIPSRDIAAVVERSLDLAIVALEKRKFGATSRPRRSFARSSANPRHIPAQVMWAVWRRDGGRCAYASGSGQRCEATSHLEFDHVVPVAQGGESTVDNLRLLCRAHNQYAAEQTFGAEFMRGMREAAHDRAQERRDRAPADSQPKPKRVGPGSRRRTLAQRPWSPWGGSGPRGGRRGDHPRRAAGRARAVRSTHLGARPTTDPGRGGLKPALSSSPCPAASASRRGTASSPVPSSS